LGLAAKTGNFSQNKQKFDGEGHEKWELIVND